MCAPLLFQIDLAGLSKLSKKRVWCFPVYVYLNIICVHIFTLFNGIAR